MAIFFAGCDVKENGNKEQPEQQYDLTTKKGIEAYVNDNWQDYGYSAKPDKYIALSFDDGPCAPSASGGTAAMLAALDAVKVKATFFMIGSNVRSNIAVAQAVFDAGHELGNHSDGYDSLGSATVNASTTSLSAASAAIKEITGEEPVLFRAPNLNHGTNLDQSCANLGMALINGSTHNDWDGTGHTPTSIKNSVLSNPQNGGIIILHDNNTSKGDTMAALPDIVVGLRAKGFWIMTVSQLAIVKGKTPEAGTRYGSF